ncbi:SIMPL domain-containing protein [Dactylosporangium sp. CS-047395]|uniref:SIMPL domain-containing protein n=1 Tax=Dactylosporangium sp. CS-047395 TaxID=3239936 RepID=UPI003D90FA5A
MFRSRAVALAALVVLSSALPGLRPAAAAEIPFDGSIVVTGTGEVSGRPDTLTADLAAETNESTVDKAMSLATAAATRMRDALLHAGLAEADLQTSNVSVAAQRDDHGTVTGYTVTQGVSATIRDLPKAGAILSAAVAAGGEAARLNGVWYAIEDDTALLAEARGKAFADARAKAELYARAAGGQLGPLVSVREVPVGDLVPVPAGGPDYRSGMDAPIPIEPGRQRLTVTVTVEWTLQPLPTAVSLRGSAGTSG